MKTFTWAFLTHAALLCTSFSSLGYSQAFFACEDTNYESNTEPNILRSQYHLLQTFGDASFRTSNFFEQDYNGVVAWMESRFFFPRLSEIIDSPVPLPDPYITGIIKGLKDIDWGARQFVHLASLIRTVLYCSESNVPPNKTGSCHAQRTL